MRVSPIRDCHLCEKQSELQDSHLLPRAAYKRMRSDDINPNPIIVNYGSAAIACDQVKERLLCSECEQRFNYRGESWVMANCVQKDGSFPIRDKLLATKPARTGTDGGFRIYSTADIPDGPKDTMLYFASSVFWRASVIDWRFRKEIIRASLGPYEESLRQYLMDEAMFPDNMVLIARVSSFLDNQEFATFPIVRNKGGYRQHEFTMLGMEFQLFVGKKIPAYFEPISHSHSPERYIVMCQRLDAALYSSLIPTMSRHPDPRRKKLARVI